VHNADLSRKNCPELLRAGVREERKNMLTNTKQIRIAKPNDLEFILDLAKKHTNQIGFIPRQATETYLAWRQIAIAMENDQPAGYLLHKHNVGDLPGVTAIHQAAICYDLRRRHLGMELVAHVRMRAALAGNAMLQLWCRGDIEANEFWRAAGFEAMGLRDGGTGRDIPHILWRIPVATHARLDAPISQRRRGRAGVPFNRTPGCNTHDIIEAARTGKLHALLADFRQRFELNHHRDAAAATAVTAQLTAVAHGTPETAVTLTDNQAHATAVAQEMTTTDVLATAELDALPAVHRKLNFTHESSPLYTKRQFTAVHRHGPRHAGMLDHTEI
jgi:N-acetylglutamate synthase-like GNAT family acetyltransferase